MTVRFDKKWFNPLFFILNDIIKDDNIRTVLVYGGKSSAKTASISQILVKQAVLKSASSIAFRKESTTVPTTLKKSFNLAVKTTRLYPAIETQDRRYVIDNGSEIVLKGLDDEEKAKGVEGYTYLYLDELNHFAEAEYVQFNLSLRGMQGQKIFASWNPVDENSWVKTNVIDQQEWFETEWKLPCEDSFVRISGDGKTILIKTTYQDNYWISGSPCGTYGYRDENLINEYEKLRATNYHSYSVNVLGEWGKVVHGGEFLKCWKSEKHVGIYPYNSDLAIYLSFDENVVPYFPCGIFQVQADQKTARMIAVLTPESPNNKVDSICREITRLLHTWGHKGRVYITGDATSQKDDVKQEKGHDLFRLITNHLTEFNPTRIVPSSNPSVVTSAEFLNAVLESNVQGLEYGVDKSCKKAIVDYENTKEDKNGKIDKSTVKNPITKVTYQPYGHIVDLTRYFFCTVFAAEYSIFQRGVTRVPTSGKNISKHGY